MAYQDRYVTGNGYPNPWSSSPEQENHHVPVNFPDSSQRWRSPWPPETPVDYYDNNGVPMYSTPLGPPIMEVINKNDVAAQKHWVEQQLRYSPTDSVDDILASPHLLESPPEQPTGGRGRTQRRPSNRDEFDGPHQFLQRPPPEYIALQERELPHLPTNLLVHEQESLINQVNDRLSQCAFDFMAKYQFPIPLCPDLKPVERPQDREWTEWVYLLRRLATKRRIPARVLYNGQIRQFVTVLENSLEMRCTPRSQSRPLKDDRSILQLISAGTQVAKILKDASAMEYLDKLYVATERRIQERAAARFRM